MGKLQTLTLSPNMFSSFKVPNIALLELSNTYYTKIFYSKQNLIPNSKLNLQMLFFF